MVKSIVLVVDKIINCPGIRYTGKDPHTRTRFDLAISELTTYRNSVHGLDSDDADLTWRVTDETSLLSKFGDFCDEYKLTLTSDGGSAVFMWSGERQWITDDEIISTLKKVRRSCKTFKVSMPKKISGF